MFRYLGKIFLAMFWFIISYKMCSFNKDTCHKYPFNANIDNCSWSFKTIDDPFVQICVLNKVKSMNVKIFN